MIRRGMLKALLGGAAAAPFAPAALPQASPTALGDWILASPPPPTGDYPSAIGVDHSYALKRKAFSLALKAPARRQRRQDLARSLAGGWPPGIACMHSNALWFRAQRAAAWIEEREFQDESFMTKLRHSFLGEDA